MRKERIQDLVSEIRDELKLIDVLINDIEDTVRETPRAESKKKRIYEESLALKLHNFYTGCERIFQKIADDINGGVPRTMDWHKRLLKIMSLEIEGIRPQVISAVTEKALEDYLAFRHIVRNIYGFEIDSERLKLLSGNLNKTYKNFQKDLRNFLDFLMRLTKN
ncbi:MAG: hypothetical protein HQL08_06360 [Nitrospirae bacterium]|nr:hypothetical protein [Nitrospirota bacterium]